GSVLHRIPDPSDDISKMADTEFFEGLPDPSVMANEFFQVFTLQDADSDGTGNGKRKGFVNNATKSKKGRARKAVKQWK
ncbi:hypothetical protein ABTJ67_20960, partial [Acinetobacter baumannii]